MSLTNILGVTPGALVDETGYGTDYVLQDGMASCWVGVDGISLFIQRSGSGNGVIVQAFKSGKEMGEILEEMDVEL